MNLYERGARASQHGAGEEQTTALSISRVFESEDTEVERLRAEVGRLRARNLEMMDLLGCTNPDKLVHDLRNVLNEMQLLRLLTKLDG
jgi:hypothetical protein